MNPTQFWIWKIISEELETLADNFEGAGTDAPWTGQEVADVIRRRIKNHPMLPPSPQERGGLGHE